jgi:5-methylthioribose kinase
MKFKITLQNIQKYLKQNVEPLKDVTIQKAHQITKHTNVNFVFRLETDSKRYPVIYIKQPYPFVRIKPNFPAPIDRIFYEFKALKYLIKLWKDRIPEVVYFDKENNTLTLNNVAENAKLLVREVNKGNLHLECGTDLGRLMGKLHSSTYKSNTFEVRGPKANQKHIDFILDFRLRGAREICPVKTQELFKESNNASRSLVFGDWPHKNLFITNDGKLKIVDFENVMSFDPAYDIGYGLADWFLEINESNLYKIKKFIIEFSKNYQQQFKEVEEKLEEVSLNSIFKIQTRR